MTVGSSTLLPHSMLSCTLGHGCDAPMALESLFAYGGYCPGSNQLRRRLSGTPPPRKRDVSRPFCSPVAVPYDCTRHWTAHAAPGWRRAAWVRSHGLLGACRKRWEPPRASARYPLVLLCCRCSDQSSSPQIARAGIGDGVARCYVRVPVFRLVIVRCESFV
jgi:hypothetical protein